LAFPVGASRRGVIALENAMRKLVRLNARTSRHCCELALEYFARCSYQVAAGKVIGRQHQKIPLGISARMRAHGFPMVCTCMRSIYYRRGRAVVAVGAITPLLYTTPPCRRHAQPWARCGRRFFVMLKNASNATVAQNSPDRKGIDVQSFTDNNGRPVCCSYQARRGNHIKSPATALSFSIGRGRPAPSRIHSVWNTAGRYRLSYRRCIALDGDGHCGNISAGVSFYQGAPFPPSPSPAAGERYRSVFAVS